ncbi:hypothetical protein [Limosilactobacillus balticus]|uniref:Lipoprotein n=1 Tax=Limosilactobacillus balticus TaxID=2759747 RepID=A0ABS8R9Q1_9LACO|nr:hypothetical protein [Limosilactobacillus balticus]MBB1128089.1 hypothetical protein [Limosilactobacillus balticus]MCD7137739.1 hypothetical protein [Limosilactobacillus balticus]
MMKMTNKVLASSLVILAALGLVGCTNSAAAPTKTSISATKVSQQTSKKAASSTSSEKAKKQTPNSVQSTSAINASSKSTSSKVKVANSSEKLTDQTTKATSSSVTSNPSSQSVTTNSSSQNDQQVLTSFVKTSGVQQDGNHYYMTKNNQNNNYQIEVRNNQGGDPNVAHLTGTYQYDPATNQIHEMNPITGNYDN